MALDTLRAAVWPPSDVPLDYAGRRFPGWRDRPVCAELHNWRRDRRLRPGMAVDCGSVVCAADGMSASHCLEQNENGRNFEFFLKNFSRLLSGNRFFAELVL